MRFLILSVVAFPNVYLNILLCSCLAYTMVHSRCTFFLSLCYLVRLRFMHSSIHQSTSGLTQQDVNEHCVKLIDSAVFGSLIDRGNLSSVAN